MADELSPEQIQQELFELAKQSPPSEPVAPAEAVAESVAEPPQQPQSAPPEPPEAAIPSWRLREEAEARRLAETRAASLEARLNEIATHLKQSQKAPNFFENPDQATQEILTRTLQPFIEEQRRTMMYLGKAMAENTHGADKVSEAERAFLEARSAGTLDPADYERVVQSPNRYDAAVQWHRRQTVFASVGDDPKAWFQKELANQLTDPKFQAQLLEQIRSSAATRPSVTKLPPSLSRTTAAASNSGDVDGDMSDASLFAHAMKR